MHTVTDSLPAGWARITEPRSLGATVIPISGGNTDRQIMVMKDFRVTAICCTPSYFLHMIERARELGVEIRVLPLRVGVFGAEPWTQSMRKHIEESSSIQAFDIYGLSELGRGQDQAARVPVEQRHLQRLLQRGNLAGDRGLAKVQRVAGMRETARLGHSVEHAQLIPVHPLCLSHRARVRPDTANSS